MKALLLCAGFGTRLRPITLDAPKPAVPFLGIPLAHWTAELLRGTGVSHFVINSHYLHADLVKMVSSSWFGRCSTISHEQNQPLGSGGALWFARQHFAQNEENFWVANADEVVLPSKPGQLEAMLQLHLRSQALATMAVIEHPDVGTKFGGVWADDQGRVIGFGKKRLPGSTLGLHNVGIYIINRKIFAFLPSGESNLLYDAFTKALQSGATIQTFRLQARWYETGMLVDYQSAAISVLQTLLSQNPSVESGLLRTLMTNSGYSIQGNCVCRPQVFPKFKALATPHRIFIGGALGLPTQINGFNKLTADLVLDGWGPLSEAHIQRATQSGGHHFLRKNGELVSSS